MIKHRITEYIARLSGAVITLILLTFVVLFAQVLIVQLVWLYSYEKPLPAALPDSPEWKMQKASKYFLPDGTINLVFGTGIKQKGDYAKEEITDVNGTILWQGIHKDRPFKYLDWASYEMHFGERYMQDISRLTPVLPGFIEVPVRIAGELKEVWRYDVKDNVFAGYEIEVGLKGYLGAGGFVNSMEQAQPLGEFKGSTSWTDENPSSVVMLWLTKRRIYQIDFRSRKVESVFENAQSDIESVWWHHWRPMDPRDHNDSDIQYRPLICCRTADNKHHLIMREPDQVIVVDPPEQMRESNQIVALSESKLEFTATDNTIYMKYTEGNFNPPASPKLRAQYRHEYYSKLQPQSIQLYKVIDDGKLELVNRFDWTRPPAKTSYPLNREEIFKKWASKTSPPVFDLLWHLFSDYLYKVGHEEMSMMQGYSQIIMSCRPRCSSVCYALSAALAIFSLWHGWARRTSWSRLIFWAILVGLFNLAGLLTYFALNHTAIIKCPVCGKKRGLERIDCIRCGNTLPIPPRKPTDLILAT